MDTTVRLRLATRIHFALLRHYGEDVSVRTLLRGGADAREAMWVCEASPHAELVALARELQGSGPTAQPVTRSASLQRGDGGPAVPAAPSPQDALWARDTSGFGVTGPGKLDPDAADAAAAPKGWFTAARWRRFGGGRSRR